MDNRNSKDYTNNSLNFGAFALILTRYKPLILGMTAISVILAGIYSFVLPKMFRVDTVLEVGQIDGALVESPSQIIQKITNDVYVVALSSELAVSPSAIPEIKVTNLNNTNLIKISTDLENREYGKKVLESLSRIIITEHDIRVKNWQKNIESQKIEFQNSKLIFESTLERQLKSGYMADIGMALITDSIRSHIDDLQDRIDKDNKSLDGTYATKVSKPATSSEVPISLRPIQNMIIAGILGLFIGIFIASLKDWWTKANFSYSS